MVSFWPWGKDDASPASFEKALSALSAKITTTQTRLEQDRAKSRRVKVLSTLYLGFAYLVYGIVLVLVVGWTKMGPWEWTGLAGGPIMIAAVRAVITSFFDYRIQHFNARLKEYQTERAKTIQKLKDATKYDSTLELLEKYGGAENKQKKGQQTSEEGGDGSSQEKDGRRKGKHQGLPQRTNMPPPPTANIQRSPVPGAGSGTPQPRPQSRPGTLTQQRPQQQHHQQQPDHDTSSSFAPNAFEGQGQGQVTPAFMQYPPAAIAPPTESHWYDRILDTLLGEDETAAKNRIVLLCSQCRLVNGQAPPGTKSLADLGQWKCMACGAANGEMDEGRRIVQEVLGGAKPGVEEVEGKSEEEVGEEDHDVSRSSSDLVEVEVERDVPEKQDSTDEGKGNLRKRKGKGGAR
ncbi:uncharacterized protein C8A04DRAFT_28710 [Dichotomopilus funicola]|uniref:Endoplasmic reticulum junction formation protein lunapark n=1 Tax=Dichotomopilus funicola TaxID=1934379 RepID=A0AAN6V2B2_9PEZI|nr:hypothetical protein C8A04DRAFT_28710 [Dichotomopilus funicola]